MANDTDYGLAASIWTRDISTAHKLAKKIRAGSVRINTAGTVDPAMPLGGYKQSGWGRENGREGTEIYTEVKSVTVGLIELRLHHRRRRRRRLRARQSTERRSTYPRAAGGGGRQRRSLSDSPAAGHVAGVSRSRADLGLRERAGAAPERPRARRAARPRAGRLLVHQRHVLHARTFQRFRRLAGAGRGRLELRARAAVLQEARVELARRGAVSRRRRAHAHRAQCHHQTTARAADADRGARRASGPTTICTAGSRKDSRAPSSPWTARAPRQRLARLSASPRCIARISKSCRAR